MAGWLTKTVEGLVDSDGWEIVLNERTTESACALALEVSEELEQALRSQHMRLSGETNPRLIGWACS